MTIIKTKIEFGETYQDVITGFKGVCTGIAKYQYGCVRALIQPKVDNNGKISEGEWLDEEQLEGIKSVKKMPGGPMPSPKRAQTPKK